MIFLHRLKLGVLSGPILINIEDIQFVEDRSDHSAVLVIRGRDFDIEVSESVAQVQMKIEREQRRRES